MRLKKHFTQIPNMIIKNTNISDSLFRTYVAIRSYAYGQNAAFPSQETLAKDLGKARETINRHVGELAELGYITKSRRGYSMTNRYDFCDKNITNDSDKSGTSIVTNISHQKLQNHHTNNTNNNTNNNTGNIEILRKKMMDLRLKKNNGKKEPK